jgi:hypothetical protein
MAPPRAIFGQDRYAAAALGTDHVIGSSFADADLFVGKRGLSESVVPGIDNDVLNVESDDAVAADVVRRVLLDRGLSRELWNQPTLPMALQGFVGELVDRGRLYVHLEFGRATTDDPYLLLDTTWLAPETLVLRERDGRRFYEQFVSRHRFAGEPGVILDSEPDDDLVEIPSDEVLYLRWPLEQPDARHPPSHCALRLGETVGRHTEHSLLSARAAAEPEETFLPLARARAGAFANALEKQKDVSARIKDILLYPGAYEAEFFPWVDDVTDYFRADRMLRSRIGICRIRDYVFAEFNRQVLDRWARLNAWGKVRLVHRADLFSEEDWRAMHRDLMPGALSLDDVRAAIAAEYESAASYGRFAEARAAARGEMSPPG